MKQLQSKLQTIGLSNSESGVLEHLVREGTVSVYHISKEVLIPRQTIYSILERLVFEGLVTYSDRSGTRQYYSSIEIIQSYIYNKIKLLEAASKKLKSETKSKMPDQKTSKSKLEKVRYFNGEYGLAYLFDAALKDLTLTTSNKNFFGFGVNSYAGTGIQKVLKRFVKNRSKVDVTTELIISNNDDDLGVTGDDAYKRQIKKIDIESQKAGCYIIDEKVYFFSYEDQVGIRIEHPHIAKLMTSIFQYVWRGNSN